MLWHGEGNSLRHRYRYATLTVEVAERWGLVALSVGSELKHIRSQTLHDGRTEGREVWRGGMEEEEGRRQGK